MTGNVEREFKLLIPDEAAFAALLARLGGPVAAPVLQLNHFFDTPAGDLRRARIALRLRQEIPPDGRPGLHALTLKGPLLADQAALAARPEEELVLSEPVAREILRGTRPPLEPFRTSALALTALVRRALELVGTAPLRSLGSFENERTRVGPLHFPPGSAGPPLVFELDRTRFPGGRVERELEVELPPGTEPTPVAHALHELFTALGLPPEPASSKAARFFRALATSPTLEE